MKTITIQVPDDCEVKIIKKGENKEPVIRTYQDLINNKIELKGSYITNQSDIMSVCGRAFERNKLIAKSEKVAKSMLAMAIISQLMPYYGGAITDTEWENCENAKYIIVSYKNKIATKIYTDCYHYFLAFHTSEQRDEFLKYNEQLVKDYLML